MKDESVEFCQKRAVPLPGIANKFFLIDGQVVEERFDALFIQIFPVGSVASFLQPVSIEDLLELVLHRNRQVRLA